VGVVLSWPLRSASGEGPAAAVVVEAEVDESAQVERGDSVSEAELVAFDAAVADASVTVGDEPGNGSFDHWSPVPVVVCEVAVAPRAAGFDEGGVVLADVEGASGLAGGAALTECAAVADRPPLVSTSHETSGDGSGVSGGAGRGSVAVIDDEVVAVEPARDRSS
jgi:hypothetical protein